LIKTDENSEKVFDNDFSRLRAC